MAINKREQMLLIITVVMVVVGVNYFAVAPLFGRWQMTDQRLEMQARELTAIRATIARQPEWQRDYDKLGQGLQQSERYERDSDIQKRLNELVAGSGILMQSKRSLKTEERDVYREWPVQCTFEATTESLVKFLYGLQTGSGFMTVEQLNLTAKPDGSGILRCDIQIRALAAKVERPPS